MEIANGSTGNKTLYAGWTRSITPPTTKSLEILPTTLSENVLTIHRGKW